MKSIRIFLLVIAVLAGTAVTSHAQSLLERAAQKAKSKLEEKAAQRVEQKVDEKIDEKIDETLEENNQNQSSSQESRDEKNQQRMQNIMKGLGVSGEPVPVEKDYAFSTMIRMHLQTIDGKGKTTSEGDFVTYVDPGATNFAYEILSEDIAEKGKGIFIFDMKNNASIMLNEENGKKTGLVYGLGAMMGDESAMQELTKEEEAAVENVTLNPYFKKTGRKKNIEGYSCDEYEYDNPEEQTKGNYWITNDLKFKSRDLYGTILKTAAWAPGIQGGQLMEAESTDKKTGEKSIMKVTEINQKASKKFTLAEYEVTNLGSITIPEGK
jgi:Tfp pilus assembly protein PilE